MKPGAMIVRAVGKRLSAPLLLVSLAGWWMVAGLDGQAPLAEMCLSVVSAGQPGSGSGRLWAAPAFDVVTASGVPAVLLSWLAMLMAMMAPLLAQPIAHLRRRSLPRRRLPAIALFVAGYVAVWLAAGIALTALALALGTGAPAFTIAVLLALAWQAAPFKQLCLNRCHRLPRLSAFGLEADADALRYGVSHGMWCIGACWALMLLPLAAGSAHVAAMAAVTLLLLVERHRPARPPRWGVAPAARLAPPVLARPVTMRSSA